MVAAQPPPKIFAQNTGDRPPVEEKKKEWLSVWAVKTWMEDNQRPR